MPPCFQEIAGQVRNDASEIKEFLLEVSLKQKIKKSQNM